MNSTQSLPILLIPQPNNPTKLLIFNVHDIFLDTNLLNQPNPNLYKKTTSCRFLFWPRMMEFLGKCFKIFKVLFWGIKSKNHMKEVLCKLLWVFDHLEGYKPMFSWSAKDCTKKWWGYIVGETLTKVQKKWPYWDATNTVIIDHHELRLDCNPHGNIIIPSSFYVANMKDHGKMNI